MPAAVRGLGPDRRKRLRHRRRREPFSRASKPRSSTPVLPSCRGRWTTRTTRSRCGSRSTSKRSTASMSSYARKCWLASTAPTWPPNSSVRRPRSTPRRAAWCRANEKLLHLLTRTTYSRRLRRCKRGRRQRARSGFYLLVRRGKDRTQAVDELRFDRREQPHGAVAGEGCANHEAARAGSALRRLASSSRRGRGSTSSGSMSRSWRRPSRNSGRSTPWARSPTSPTRTPSCEPSPRARIGSGALTW